MGDISPTGRDGKKRRLFGVRWPLFVVAICFFVAWAVLFGRQIWTDNDPLRLIHRGTVAQRQKAALELGDVAEGRDIDQAIASLLRAMKDTDVVAPVPGRQTH